MNNGYEDLFAGEIEIPDIVQKKADEAFAQIRMQTKHSLGEKRGFLGLRHTKAAAIVCAVIVGGCSITAAAATYFHWSRGMSGELPATEAQQMELQDQGMASLVGQSVTDNGITVTANQVIVDKHYAFLSFSVEGYSLEEGVEPCFQYIDVYQGDAPEAEGSWLNMWASFFDGIVPNGEGGFMYYDGTSLKEDSSGAWIGAYTDENGEMEYLMTLSTPDRSDSLIGKTIHVCFQNIGSVHKTSYEEDLDGTWEFEINLVGCDEIDSYELNEKLGDTRATVTYAEISPISIMVNYDFPRQQIEELAQREDGSLVPTTFYSEPPALSGVRLKDGTLLPYLMNGGSTGYIDEDSDTYQYLIALDRVLDVDQVDALLFVKSYPEGENEFTEDNFFIVPLK